MRLAKRLRKKAESLLESMFDSLLKVESDGERAIGMVNVIGGISIETLGLGDESHEHEFTETGWRPGLGWRTFYLGSGDTDPPLTIFHTLFTCKCGKEEIRTERQSI